MAARQLVHIRIRQGAIETVDRLAVAQGVSRSDVVRAALGIALKDVGALGREIERLKEQA